MKTHFKLVSFLAASLLAFLSISHAQPQTFDTTPSYQGSTFTFGAGTTMGQTFTNALAVQSMTYNFFLGSGGASSDVTLSAVFGEWNLATADFIEGTTVSLNGGAFIPASGSTPNGSAWGAPESNLVNGHGSYPTYTFQFDLTDVAAWTDTNTLLNAVTGYTTSAGSVYALMLTNSGAATSLALGQTNTNVFAYGQAYLGGGPDPENYSRDWTFSQLSITPNPVIPESSTVAAILGCVLVAGLVGFRLRQQRQQQLAPVAATIA